MRIKTSPMRKRERHQCVSEIRTHENREKSHEDERNGSVCK
jgi:hypothetical protein